MNVIEALGEVAQEKPDTLGLSIPHRNLWGLLSYQHKTFQQMDHEVDVWATYFLSKGFSKGKKILLMLPPGEDLLISVFAMLRLGAIPVVIDPGMGLKNFFNCAKKTRPDLFLGCHQARLLYYILKPFVRLKKAIIFTKALKEKILKENFACHLQKEDRNNDVAAVLFTSGSTGYPKGAVYTYGEFNAQIDALKSTFNIEADEIDIPLLPVFSLYNPALGMTTIVPEMDPAKPSQLDPEKIIEAIQTNGVTNSFGSPRLWTKLIDYCEENDYTLPTIKRIFLAGAPVHPSLLKRIQAILPKGTAFTPYGATEALPIAYISATEVLEDTYQLTLQGKGTCVGHSIAGVKIRIIPIKDEVINELPEELSLGEVGEIAVYAPYVSKSYLNDLSATAKAKINHQGEIWHRMGDLGYKDEQGRLWFCGRKAERVICPEKTYYTDCYEAVFNAHKAVFRSALIAFESNGKTSPAIIIEPKKLLNHKEEQYLLHQLQAWADTTETTKDIHHFAIYYHFPVDVRHNAKIHRLTLRRYFQKHPKKIKFL